MTHAEMQAVLRNAGWPDVMVSSRSGNVPLLALMSAIGMAESSGNPRAINSRGEYSVGVWQINIAPHLRRPYRASDLQEPSYNARVALQIYEQQGLRAWGAYTDGRYRHYLNEALATYTAAPRSNTFATQAYKSPEELLAALNPDFAEYLNGSPVLVSLQPQPEEEREGEGISLAGIAVVFGGLLLTSALINR